MSEEVLWESVDDGEYNEITATVNGHEVFVYSDRDGHNWDYRIDERDGVSGYDSKSEAQKAAIQDASGS